jgi:hypothetical protein
MRTATLTFLLLLIVPASALAVPQWHVRTLATGEGTFLRASDARGDRRLVLVDERLHGAEHVLDLRIGQTRRILATGRHGFEDVRVGHDGRDRVTVTWAVIPGDKGPRRAYAYTQGVGAQLIGGATNRSVSNTALSVAPDGSAVLALWRSDGIFASRRDGGGRFGAPVQLGGPADFFILAGAGPGGRAVVAWAAKGRLMAAVAPGAGDFQAPQDLGPGTDAGIASTPEGRVVVAAHADNRLVAFDLPAAATAFGLAQTLSQAAFTGVPALVARNETVFIGWTEGDLGAVASRLRTVRWGSTLSAPSTYSTGHDLGSRRATLRAQAMPGVAARFYYRTVGNTTRWFTVWFDEQGRAHGAARVTPPGEREALDLEGELVGARSVAVWTTRFSRSNKDWRIRIATP